jgi:hypothetical protein
MQRFTYGNSIYGWPYLVLLGEVAGDVVEAEDRDCNAEHEQKAGLLATQGRPGAVLIGRV